MIDVSAALSTSVNQIQLFVRNRGLIIGGAWSGRFEIYINGGLVGAYADEGTDVRPNQTHLVADIELQLTEPPRLDRAPEVSHIIQRLSATPGMTNASRSDLPRAHAVLAFQNGVTISLYKNALGVDHVFVTDHTGACVFGGYVGWIHSAGLERAIADIRVEYAQCLR